MARKHTDLSRTKEFPIIPRLIATSFGVGFLPLAPGTWGALLAIILWLPLWVYCPDRYLVMGITVGAAVVFGLAGVWASNISEKYWGKDPVEACIDETVGQWLALAAASLYPHEHWWIIIVAFVLFRLLDIFKPFGIRHAEDLPGGWGMMMDDVFAGLATALVVFGIRYHMLSVELHDIIYQPRYP